MRQLRVRVKNGMYWDTFIIDISEESDLMQWGETELESLDGRTYARIELEGDE